MRHETIVNFIAHCLDKIWSALFKLYITDFSTKHYINLIIRIFLKSEILIDDQHQAGSQQFLSQRLLTEDWWNTFMPSRPQIYLGTAMLNNNGLK